MKNHHDRQALLILLPLLLSLAALSGCAGKQQQVSDLPPTDLTLEYRVPDDKPLRYRTIFEQTHRMDLQGDSREFVFNKALEFSMQAEGSDEDSQKLTVTVHSLMIELDTPRGPIQKRVNELEGKSFGMVVSPLGEELKFSGVSAVKYDLPPAGVQNVQSEFEAFFPDLAGRSLAVGDSWAIETQVADTAFNSGKKINLQIVHTFEGFETVDGMNCAKITTVLEGSLDDSGERMTRAPEMTAKFTGSGVTYLAHEEGWLVRTSTTLRGSGVSASGGGQGPPGEMSQEIKVDTHLLQGGA
jgi:hypothetical protein